MLTILMEYIGKIFWVLILIASSGYGLQGRNCYADNATNSPLPPVAGSTPSDEAPSPEGAESGGAAPAPSEPIPKAIQQSAAPTIVGPYDHEGPDKLRVVALPNVDKTAPAPAAPALAPLTAPPAAAAPTVGPTERLMDPSQATIPENHEASRNHFEIDYVFSAFGSYNFNTTVNGIPPTSPAVQSSHGINIEWMHFLLVDSFGRYGIGLRAGIYESGPTANISGLGPDFMNVGIRATYQFQFMDNQIFVPFLVGGFDRIHLQTYINNQPYAQTFDYSQTPPVGYGTQAGPALIYSAYWGAGLAFNFNSLNWRKATDALVHDGIRKVLFVYTLEMPSAPIGPAQSLGLRFEF